MAPSPSPTVSVTIVLHNSERELERCLEAIRPEILSGFAELIAVDNASPDGSAGTVARSLPDARIIRSEENLRLRRGRQPRLASRARSLLAASEPGRRARRRRDREARRVDGPAPASGRRERRAHGSGRRRTPLHRAGTAIALAGAVRGIAAPSPPSGTLRGRVMRGAYWRGGDQLDAGWVPATALLVRRQAVDSAGLLDERFFLYGEDIEWCWRMRRAGWSIGVCSCGACSSPGGWQRFSHLCRRGCPAPYGRGRDRGGAKAPRRPLCALLRPCHRPCAQTRGASPRAVHGAATDTRAAARTWRRAAGGGTA